MRRTGERLFLLLDVTFSFPPKINEVVVVLLFGLFGRKVAALSIGSGLLIAIIAGMIIWRLHLERSVEDFVWKLQVGSLFNVVM
jgi:uncharacterized membrane protein YraQ (UPF0718 family)